MKIITFLILSFFTTFIFSQNTASNADAGFQSAIFSTRGAANGIGTFVNPTPKKRAGSIHLFKSWMNIGEINVDQKKYKMLNINFNVETNKFETKVGNDSIFVFNISNIENIYVNKQKFQSFYFPKKSKNEIFEIIYDGDDMKLIKGHEISIVYGDPDPAQVKKTQGKNYKISIYYVKNGNSINKVVLKKKAILSLFGAKKTAVASYVKENKLSYKKDRDLNRIFIYHNSL